LGCGNFRIYSPFDLFAVDPYLDLNHPERQIMTILHRRGSASAAEVQSDIADPSGNSAVRDAAAQVGSAPERLEVDFSHHFRALGAGGTFVLRDLAANRVVAHRPELANNRPVNLSHVRCAARRDDSQLADRFASRFEQDLDSTSCNPDRQRLR
jgi:hypothetical protein